MTKSLKNEMEGKQTFSNQQQMSLTS